MKNPIESYRNRYQISRLDLADSAETNRLHMLVVSPILFVFGLFDLFALVIVRYTSFKEHVVSLVYFGLFTVFGIFFFFYSLKVKNVGREKAYIYKTIPFYILFWLGIMMGVYNFYILGQPFNGVITYCLTGFISLCVFSFSPIWFLLGLVVGMGIMAPGIYKNFGITGLADSILATILMFGLSLYKRRNEKKLILLLKKQKKSLVAKTFGNFTLLYDNSVIKFSRTKSTELLAYLIYKNGSSVKTKELISVLWGDHANSARHGANFRNLIVDIKHSLAELEIQNFFLTEYNNFRINPESIQCDYYDFLNGDSQAINSFAGEFMSQYSWAEDVIGFLEMRAMKK